MMTGDVSSEWPQAQVGPWLIALALSCAIHGAIVWEGLTLSLPKRQWVENVLPVELVNPPPEPSRPSPPPPKPRPVVPPKPVASVPQPVTPEPPRPKLEEPARETP
ncbi:MAG TPA: hypothetical protein VJX92_05825, partial [Methylomirabilota bacterium]|nr:hypothetical protein [Methylomirabilota bacterium]